MPKHRPSKFVIGAQLSALVIAGGVAIAEASRANWNLPLLGALFAIAVISDLTAIETRSRLKISSTGVALILAIVFLGATPAMLIGETMILLSWLRWRTPPQYLVNNVLAFSILPLAGGIAVGSLEASWNIGPTDAGFYLMVLGVYFAFLAFNFSIVAGYRSYVEQEPFWPQVRSSLLPFLPTEVAAGLLTVGVAYIYDQVGVTSIALFGLVVLTFQHLLGQLLVSQERAEELEARGKQLVSFQVGMLSALMRTLDLRDEMTARHCASVARYCRAIAHEAGLSEEDQELVHVAGLLHDIGKFILPDKILKANVPLDDDDWNLIKMHPAQGAKVVGSVEGYGPVAKIIMAHHERIDGTGYPRRLKGDEIPELSRIISVADTYDVMTARDSYRDPVSSFEAIQELQRVAGAQLDERFVKVFVEKVLEGKDLDYRHGADADFDFELALEERIAAVEEGAGFLVGVERNGDGDHKKHRDAPVATGSSKS
jgi:putative nucleotidyltransferase with HDIG domain